jgi:hypothetical protein
VKDVLEKFLKSHSPFLLIPLKTQTGFSLMTENVEKLLKLTLMAIKSFPTLFK